MTPKCTCPACASTAWVWMMGKGVSAPIELELVARKCDALAAERAGHPAQVRELLNQAAMLRRAARDTPAVFAARDNAAYLARVGAESAPEAA